MLTSDKKWITYCSGKSKWSWSKYSKQVHTNRIHSQKRVLCLWWHEQGIRHYKLLSHDLKEAITPKFPVLTNKKEVVFHEGNARALTSIMSCLNLLKFGWKILIPPLYSVAIAPSEYYLYSSMAVDFVGEVLIVPIFYHWKHGFLGERHSKLENGRKLLSHTVHIWHKSVNTQFVI